MNKYIKYIIIIFISIILGIFISINSYKIIKIERTEAGELVNAKIYGISVNYYYEY